MFTTSETQKWSQSNLKMHIQTKPKRRSCVLDAPLCELRLGLLLFFHFIDKVETKTKHKISPNYNFILIIHKFIYRTKFISV